MIPDSPVQLHADPAPRPAAIPPNATASEAGLAEAFGTIRKRKYIVLGAALLGMAYGWYKASTQPRLYNASSTIEIRLGSANQFRLGNPSSFSQGSVSSDIATQSAILKSDTLLLTVARDLDLANNRVFMGAKGPMPHRNLDNPAVRDQMIGMLNADVSVDAIPKTDLIKITCSTLDPNLSAEIVNKLVADYIQRSFQTRFDATQRASGFLSLQLRDLKQQVEQSQAQLIDLGKRIGVLGFDPTHNQITANLEDLNKAVGTAEINRILAQSRYQVLSETDRDALDSTIDSSGVTAAGGSTGSISQLTQLRGTLATDRAQYAMLTAPGNLGPNNPQVQAIGAQIKELEKEISEQEQRILTQAHEELVAARANEQETRGALETEKADAYKLRDALIEYTLRQREYESSRSLYENLLDRLRTAGVQAGLESTEIDIVDSALPPIAPSLEPRSTILLIDTIVMLIVGLILAFIVDSLDTGIQSVTELETITGLPAMALIPRARRVQNAAALSVAQRNIAVLSSPKSQFAEAFRALRTSLLLSTPGGEPNVILVTSSTPSEGKTTAAINLAAVLAQRGVRVLIIDADLRRPTVHHRFGINGKNGLTSILSGTATLEQSVQNVSELPDLDILTSGPVPPFPTEMLSSAVMQQLLQEARGKYTHIVMDSPPLLSVTDSVVLARDADTVVMIVRHGKSSKHAVRRGRELLARAGAPATGIAMNAVDLNSPEYYSYYGYYGYSGYSSAGVDSTAWQSQNSNEPRKRRSKGGAE